MTITETPATAAEHPTIIGELAGTMWADLFTAEMHAKSGQHHVTRRALTYLTVGLPIDDVLDALKIDGEAWTARVASYEAWTAENRAAAGRLTNPGRLQLLEDVRYAFLAAGGEAVTV